MDTVNIVLCGVGGQDIFFMTKVLAQAGLDKGFNVMGTEPLEMALCRESVVSHLRFGDVEGSLVRTDSARLLLALDEDEAYRNLPYVSRGGRMYVNAISVGFPREEIRDYLSRKEIVFRGLRAEKIALDLGRPLSTNLALLGYFAAMEESLIGAEEMRATIQRISPERFREINLRIFDAGAEKGREEKSG